MNKNGLLFDLTCSLKFSEESTSKQGNSPKHDKLLLNLYINIYKRHPYAESDRDINICVYTFEC